MIEFDFEQDAAKLNNFIAILGNGLTEGMPGLVMRAAQHASGTIREVVLLRFPDGRTGALARSWRETFLGREGEVVGAAAHSELVYARILDEGGVIRPKTVEFLAVPVRKQPVGKWPRHWGEDELHLIPGKGGKPSVLATITRVSARADRGSRRGSAKFKRPKKVRVVKDKITPQYVLLKQVTIKPSNYILYSSVVAQPGIEEIMGEGLGRIATKATEGQ